jgi:hypothetical protein
MIYLLHMSYTGIACIPYCIKKEDAMACMHACRHCTVNCQEDVREVLYARGRFVARRAWPCVGVMSMRLEGKGGEEERAGKMDKKLPGSSELSWGRTFGRGQAGGGRLRGGTEKGGRRRGRAWGGGTGQGRGRAKRGWLRKGTSKEGDEQGSG